MYRSLVLSALLLSAASVFAQAPYLVKDLGDSGSTFAQSSNPQVFLDSGGKLFFAATSETDGLEPWVRDAVGVRLLRDINAGSTGSNVTLFMELTPGVVIFTANDGVNGTQLWRSDGTEAGTTLLKIVNATTSSFVPLLFSYGGKVFFNADDGVHGREPWVTDGTAGGTQLLVETGSGSGSGAANFFRFGNTTRFFSSAGIWSTDGTPAGTILDIPLESYRGGLAVVGNVFYFFGYDSVHGMEPWKSDGTAAGTSMIKEIRSGTASYSISMAPTASGAVFFADDGTGGGGRLWTTDGTVANTVPLDAFPATGTANFTATLYSTTLGVFFHDHADGWKIWRTNGAQAGTYVATRTLNGGAAFGFLEAFSKVYFTSWVGASLYLFQTDGSANATAVNVLPDLPAKNVTFTGGKLWFAGTSPANGTELWVSHDGAALGTQLIANLAPDPNPSSKPVNFKAAGQHLYFHPLAARELWRSDGTSGGTIEVADNDTGVSSPDPFGSLTPFRGDLYFHHSHSGFYRVDGVSGGGTKIGEYDFDSMTADESSIYMWGSFGDGILTSDGTAAGTIPLYDSNEPEHFFGWDSIWVLPYDGYSWIRCYHGLFRTGGTVATTHRVASMPASTHLSNYLVGAGGLLYSVIYSPTIGYELWRSDGTGAGSFMVKDANPGVASSNPSNLTPAGRLLFFIATDADHGAELWRTDGTAAGTFMLKDILPGTASSQPSALASLGEVVYFAANNGTNGVELWKSDGTSEGTVLVRDLAPGVMSSKPAWLAAAGGKIWFSANEGLHGHELWSTDGTEVGTVLAGDIIPGSSSSSPDQMKAAESTLFFTAMTDVEGRELWAMPLTTGYVSAIGGRVSEGDSGTRALRFTIRRHGVATGAATVTSATLPGTATAGTDYTSGNGTISFAADETVKTIDVMVLGDTVTENNETLFLQLSSPSGVVLQDALAAGVIDDDDSRADLAAELLQNAEGYEYTSRVLKVTNHGPSNANAITVRFTESPYEMFVNSAAGVTCTGTLPSQCMISFLQPGESRTITIYRSSLGGMVNPALPPGQTVTVEASSAITDPNLSNNIVSVMTTHNGMLQLPSKLVHGTVATATFDLGAIAGAATDVTLTSSAANVIVTPATARIEAGQRSATFTLTPSAGAEKTLLTATIGGVTKAALVAPVVSSGQSPRLDVAIVAETTTPLEYGALFIIPVSIAARYPDGTVPTGLVTLLDQNENPVSQLALDTEGGATFTRPQLPPGTYQYRISYSGDGRFNTLTISLPSITIKKAASSMRIHAPQRTCSNTIEFRIVVSGSEGSAVPTGTVTFNDYTTTFGTYTLVPNGIPTQSEATVTLTFASGNTAVSASYSGDNIYGTASTGMQFSAGQCTPMNLIATATSPTSVALSWSPGPGASYSYDVYRANTIEGPYGWISRTTQAYSTVDTTVQPGRVYVYYIIARAYSGTPYYTSSLEIAGTFFYTDNPVAAGTRIKSTHLTELRSMVAVLRSAAGLKPLTFTGSVAPGNTVRAQHLTELRNSIDASRARIEVPAISWVQPNAAIGALIRAATVQELRAGAY